MRSLRKDIAVKDIVSHQIPDKVLKGRVILLTGPTGVAKTTIARALIHYHTGFFEHPNMIIVNGGDCSVDKIREIAKQIRYAPIDLPFQIVLIDEIHKLSDAAQEALNVPLEVTEHCYWFLCSSRPSAITNMIKSRAIHFKLDRPSRQAAEKVLRQEKMDPKQIKLALESYRGDLRKLFTELPSDKNEEIDWNELLKDGEKFIELASRSPQQLFIRMLESVINKPEIHSGLVEKVLSENYTIAAHQLLAWNRLYFKEKSAQGTDTFFR